MHLMGIPSSLRKEFEVYMVMDGHGSKSVQKWLQKWAKMGRRAWAVKASSQGQKMETHVERTGTGTGTLCLPYGAWWSRNFYKRRIQEAFAEQLKRSISLQ